MLKKLVLSILVFTLVFNSFASANIVELEESTEHPITPSYSPPTVEFKDFVFTVTSKSKTAGSVGFMLYPYPYKAKATPLLEGHIPLFKLTPQTYKTDKLDTSGVRSGKYVLQYWIEDDAHRSMDMINLDKPSPKNTVYQMKTVTIKTKKVQPLVANKSVGKLMVIKNDDTVLYSDSKLSKAVMTLSRGEIVEVRDEKSGYCQVMYNSQSVFVKSKHLMTPDKFAAEDPDKAIPVMACVTALKQRGSTYYWGASGSKELDGLLLFDCSGLTFYSYKTAGLNWGRYAAYTQSEHLWFQTMWRGTDPMADPAFMQVRSQMKAGDLIFYQTSANPAAWRKGITHCGIYIGNGKMVHAGDPVHVEYVDTFSMPVAGEVATNRIRALTRVLPFEKRITATPTPKPSAAPTPNTNYVN